MDAKAQNKVLYFPIKALLWFLVITEILLFIGPIAYPLERPFLLAFFLVLVNLALYFGFKRGISNGVKNSLLRKHVTDARHLNIIKFIIIFAVVLIIPKLVSTLGLSGFSPGELIGKVKEGIFSPKEAYEAKREMVKFDWRFLIMLLSPISFGALPLGVYYWKRLSFSYRLMIIVLIISELAMWLGLGTRKGLLDTFIIISVVIIGNNTKILTDKRLNRRFIMIFTASLAVFIIYFVFSNMSRMGQGGLDEMNLVGIENLRPFYAENVSPWIYVPLSNICGYLCQGYYALSCALDYSLTGADSVFTWGFGNNWFIINVAEIVDPSWDILSETYQGRLYEYYGIHPSHKWHSIYVWLANDFTFLGVPFIIYAIGYFFSKSWIGVIRSDSIWAIPMLSLFLIMVFYFFANNQVLSFSFISFVVYFALFFGSRIKLYT